MGKKNEQLDLPDLPDLPSFLDRRGRAAQIEQTCADESEDEELEVVDTELFDDSDLPPTPPPSKLPTVVPQKIDSEGKPLRPFMRDPDPLVEGVTRRGNRWQAACIEGGKLIHIGMYPDEEKAISAWRKRTKIQGDSPVSPHHEPFEPSIDQRKLVYELAMWGLPQEKIRGHVINPLTGHPISQRTLTHYFIDELTQGLLRGDSDSVRMLHTMQVGADPIFMRDPVTNEILWDKTGKPLILRSEIRPNVAANIFASKVRPGVGLRETIVLEHTKSKANEMYEKLKELAPEFREELRSLLRRSTREPDGEPEGS